MRQQHGHRGVGAVLHREALSSIQGRLWLELWPPTVSVMAPQWLIGAFFVQGLLWRRFLYLRKQGEEKFPVLKKVEELFSSNQAADAWAGNGECSCQPHSGSVAVLINAAKVYHSQKGPSDKWVAELRGGLVVEGAWSKTDTGARPKQIQILRGNGRSASSLYVPLTQHTAPSIWPW